MPGCAFKTRRKLQSKLQSEKSKWANNYSERTAFAAWRASIRWTRQRYTPSAWRWAATCAARRRDAAVLIGMDTRESGPWIAAQVAAGLAQQDVPAVSAGVITTPGVAYLTRSSSFTAGVMISASHNPYRDNGIKVFGHSGYKLPDDEEHLVEQEIFRHAGEAPGPPLPLAPDPALAERYLDYLASTVEGGFEGMRIVLDCGNGAAYQLAPALFRRLGAEVEAICCEPNGRNINLDCGALHVESLRAAVLQSGAESGRGIRRRCRPRHLRRRQRTDRGWRCRAADRRARAAQAQGSWRADWWWRR